MKEKENSVVIEGNEPLEDSTVIMGFPTIGYASVIAANYLVTEMKLPYAGAVVSHGFPPAAAIHDFVPNYPLRIHRKGKVAVFVADIMPSEDKIWDIGTMLIDWVKLSRCKEIVILEGLMPKNLEKTDEKQIFGVGSTEDVRNTLKEMGIEQIKEGLITGLSAVILAEGARRGVEVICILSESNPMYPDARAALNLLQTMAKLVPEAKVDLKKLKENADKIESRIKDSLAQAVQLMDARQRQKEPKEAVVPPSMYR